MLFTIKYNFSQQKSIHILFNLSIRWQLRMISSAYVTLVTRAISKNVACVKQKYRVTYKALLTEGLHLTNLTNGMDLKKICTQG